jgi:hypothetical protein
LSLTGAIVFLGISILIGSCEISDAIKSTNYNRPNYENELNMFNHNLEKLVESLGANK